MKKHTIYLASFSSLFIFSCRHAGSRQGSNVLELRNQTSNSEIVCHTDRNDDQANASSIEVRLNEERSTARMTLIDISGKKEQVPNLKLDSDLNSMGDPVLKYKNQIVSYIYYLTSNGEKSSISDRLVLRTLPTIAKLRLNFFNALKIS